MINIIQLLHLTRKPIAFLTINITTVLYTTTTTTITTVYYTFVFTERFMRIEFDIQEVVFIKYLIEIIHEGDLIICIALEVLTMELMKIST